MVKKIRFPLEMEYGIEVRNLEELRGDFSLVRVLSYLANGKLVTWLRDRYLDDIADIIEKLDVNDEDLPKKVCEAFGIMYDSDSEIDMEKVRDRERKLGILRDYTTDKKFHAVVDNVAFTQDDLYDLLDEEQTTIYLCGEKFSIPIAKRGMAYIGVNNPIIIIDAKEEVNWTERGITLTDVRFDDKYQKIVDSVAEKRQELNTETIEAMVRKKHVNNTSFGRYSKNSYLNFMLSNEDKEGAEHCYNILSNELGEVVYDIDGDISDLRKRLLNEGLIGLAERYLEKL